MARFNIRYEGQIIGEGTTLEQGFRIKWLLVRQMPPQSIMTAIKAASDGGNMDIPGLEWVDDPPEG